MSECDSISRLLFHYSYDVCTFADWPSFIVGNKLGFYTVITPDNPSSKYSHSCKLHTVTIGYICRSNPFSDCPWGAVTALEPFFISTARTGNAYSPRFSVFFTIWTRSSSTIARWKIER